MKILRLFLISLLFSAVMSVNFASAADTQSNITPVVLKMNEYYILYAYPKAPYINSENRLMIPLRSISDLLNAEINYNPENKTASILFDQKELLITIDSKTAYLDGKAVEMDTKAILEQNAVFIPLRIIVDSFGIDSKWDTTYRVATLTDERIMKSEKILRIEELDYKKHRVDKDNAFLPLYYQMKIGEQPDGKIEITNTITAKNISGEDIPEGKEDFHYVYITSEAYSLETGLTLGSPDRDRPRISKEEIFSRTQHLQFSYKNETLLYILVHGRTLK